VLLEAGRFQIMFDDNNDDDKKGYGKKGEFLVIHELVFAKR